ncbi:SusC/RagA family TonB-linked outer membrane protein, partial [Dawidia soli]
MHKVGFIVFIFGAAMFCTAKVQAQGNLNRKTITIPVARRASMMDVMREVQMQAGFMFVFQPLLVEQHVDLYLPEGTRTVQQFLDTVLLYTPIGFEERGRNIIIFRKLTIFTIQGRVTDSQTGEPLPLVSIAVKDENKGTVTDADGNYTIKVIKGDILIFSYAGRVPRRFKIESGDQLNVTLDALILDVVTINTGYYTVPHAEAVGNISTVLATEFKRAPVSNPVQALQGRVAGAFIEQTSGIPGSGYTIRIRGRNSLREEGNSPLYIIDGVPYPSVTLSSSLVGGDILPRSSPLNAIDPANIERIDVLKDADATAIYGSRGANGVVLITTKRATHEGPGAEARFYRGIGQVGHRMKLLNSAQWLTMRHEAFRNDNVMPNAGNARDLILWDTTRNTDWQDKLIGGTAHITNASLSVYGGEKHTQFLLAGDYRKETTVFPGSFDYIRASTLFNLKHGSQDGRFQLSLTPHYTYEKTILPVSDLTAQAIALPPVAPALYTEDGELNWENETWTNPLFNTVQTYEGKTSNFILNNTASYQIFPGFFARASLGYNAIGRDEMRLEPIRSYSPSQIANGITGTHIYARNRLTTWIAEPQLDYAMTTRNARVNVLIGATHQHSVQQGETVAAMGYTSDVVIRDPASAASFVQYESVNQAYKYAALFGRINYIWGKRYILNVTARRDGSSRFAKGSQFANFGAIGAGWIFSNESFLEKWDEVLSFGKLRFSYGTTGSDQIGDYGYLGLYGPATWGYDGSSIIAVRPENPGYSWELNKKMEAGLGLAFLKNRIQLDMSY